MSTQYGLKNYFNLLDDDFENACREASGDTYTGMYFWYEGRIAGASAAGLHLDVIDHDTFKLLCEIRSAWTDAYNKLRRAA